MNKKELIERMEGLKNLFGNECEYVKIDFVIELASELDEPQKPVVPQFVADWYEEHKDDFETNLFRAVDLIPSDYEEGELSEFEEWLVDEHTAPFQTLVNMHQFGYTVEKEPKYTVKIKSTKCSTTSLVFSELTDVWLFSATIYQGIRFKHTQKELEEAGFGWVFDCPGIEIEEVEE